MEIIVLLLPVYLMLYLVYIGRLAIGFSKVKKTEFLGGDPKTRFSIVIPFRNEARNLPQILECIKNIDYPKSMFEVIFIDDFSTDDSQKLIYRWRMENGEFDLTLIESVRRSKSPKKDAIARAVPIVAHDWIVTTDADCTLPSTWLKAINDYIGTHEVWMLAAPVIYKTGWNPLHHYQQMDLLSLQGATIGGFGIGKAFMCNGANFAYAKSLFTDLGGFAGNDDTASGDDVFLLQKAFAKYPDKVHYLKSREAIVTTAPADGIFDLFFQRVRWASKTAGYESEFAEILAWAVFLGNASIVGMFCLALSGHFQWAYLTIGFGLKFVLDMVLLVRANSFLRKGKFMFPVMSSLVYPFFCTLVACYSIVGVYRWKGRVLK